MSDEIYASNVNGSKWFVSICFRTLRKLRKFDPLKDYATTHPLQMLLNLHSQDLHTPLYTQISYFLALRNLDVRVRSTRT